MCLENNYSNHKPFCNEKVPCRLFCFDFDYFYAIVRPTWDVQVKYYRQYEPHVRIWTADDQKSLPYCTRNRASKYEVREDKKVQIRPVVYILLR